MQPQDAVTPEPVFRALSAFWVTAALRAGLDLDLFGHLAKGPRSLESLAQAAGARARSTRMLADALVSLGFLERRGELYALTPVSETFLDPAKPAYFGGMAHIVAGPMLWAEFGRLSEAVRLGGTLLEEGTLTPDNAFWDTFARHSFPMAMGNAQGVVQALKELEVPCGRILDLACGTGAYGAALAAANPGSEVTFADWPTVLEHTKRYAHAMGVSDRARYRPGDIFEGRFDGPYDVALLTNIFHHFDLETCQRLCAQVRGALRPGGAAVVVDFIAEEDRGGDPMPQLFALVMLVTTPRGDTYSDEDYRLMFEACGFTRFDLRPLPTPQQVLVAR